MKNLEHIENRRREIAAERKAWIREVEPWPEVVDGAALLDELSSVMRRFVVLPKWAAETLALWVVHTYGFELRDVTTYIALESPEKRCGKTTVLTLLSELVNRPVVASNISSPAFFRVIEETRPTLLIDEADTFLQGDYELRGILNSGYSRKTAFVVRVANEGKGREESESESRRDGTLTVDGDGEQRSDRKSKIENRKNGTVSCSQDIGNTVRGERRALPETRLAQFSCWCPKVVAAIGRLPDTLADRSIVIRMERKMADEECERLRNLNADELRQRCARFVADHAEALASAKPEIPAGMNDRAADIWEPLLAIADLAGGAWPELARNAAAGLTTLAQESNPIGALLLDIVLAFGELKAERLFSRDVVWFLNGRELRPWAGLTKARTATAPQGVTELWLAQQLKPYGIRPRTIWIKGEARKGYILNEMMPMCKRYVPQSELEALREEFRPEEPAEKEMETVSQEVGEQSK